MQAFFVFLFLATPLFADSDDIGSGDLDRIPTSSYIDSPSDFLPKFDWDPHFDMNEYQLGPGDLINFHGFGSRILYFKLYVTPDYQLVIPTVGVVNVRGKKLGDLRKSIAAKVATRYKGMDIVVALYRPRQFKIQLLGEASNPGTKTATPLTRLHEFVGAVKGLKPTASMVDIEISNLKQKTKKVVNLQKYLLHGDLSQNPYLVDGDEIFIPIQKNVAQIKGNLIRPGRYEFVTETEPLKRVIEEELGGFIANTPVGGQIVITRNINNVPTTSFIKSEEFFKGSGPLTYQNFELKDGDQLFFPTASIHNPGISSESVFVTGEVKLPAPVPYKAGSPISAYIAAAGGITVRANYDQITVYKASGETLFINDNPVIEPGDTIQVPEKTFKFWQDHLTIIVTFLSLVATTIAISR